MPARKRKAAAVAEPEPASRTRRGRPSSGANDAAPVKEAPEPAPAEAKKRGRPASKTNTNTASKDAPAADAPKRRGRPPGKAGPRAATTATKRGRPARAATMANGTGDAVTISQRGRPQRPAVIAPPHENAPSKTPERRGRPRGSTNKASSDAASAPKKRGRPPANAPPKRRGRPPKADTEAAPKAAPAKKTTSGKKRGRPAKDVSTDAPAPKRARGRPPKTAPAETSPSLDGANDEPDSEGGLVNDVINFAKENLLEPAAAALEKVTNGGGDRQYWLMKAEPESRIETTASGKEVDVQFSIDDLADKDGPEPWDGIRNPVARRNLRSMQIGDLCFFAESSCKVPGLVGTMEVVGTARPDPSQFSKDSPYYDPKASEDNPKWDMVMVEFRSKFKAKLPAAKLKEHAASPGDPLGRLELFRQTRLSVSNVKPDEWAFIMTLVEANDAAPEPSKTPKKVNKKKTDDTAVTARKPGRKSMPASTSAPKDEVTTPAAARKGKAPKAPATEPRPKTKTPKRKSGAHKSKPSDEEDEEAQPLTPTQDEPADTIPSPPQANAEEAQAEGEAEDIDAPLPSIEGFEPTSATQMESSGRGLLGRIGEGIVHALASPGKAVSRALSGTPAPPTEREKERESAVAAMGVDVGILGGVLEEDEE